MSQPTIHTESNLSLLFHPGIRLRLPCMVWTRIRIGRQKLPLTAMIAVTARCFQVLESALGFKHFRLKRTRAS